MIIRMYFVQMSDNIARACSFRTTIVVLFNLGVSDEYYSFLRYSVKKHFNKLNLTYDFKILNSLPHLANDSVTKQVTDILSDLIVTGKIVEGIFANRRRFVP